MTLRVVPLGGLGEIGMNCLALEVGKPGEGPIVVVDCGVLFPNEVDMGGVDILHPEFGWLEQNRHRVVALLVTHGHEDHIGGIPYLLRRLDVPVYAPPYALGLVRERFAEHQSAAQAGDRPGARLRQPRLFPTRPRLPFVLGEGEPIEVEPVRVTHSIADATALIIRTAYGTVVHTGDFKIEPPGGTEGEDFDEERLSAVGREGVALLLSDSTNADVAGRSRSEREVASALERHVASARDRVVVGLFASNVHRVRALCDIARRTGRRLGLLGRSVHTHGRVAAETGHLAIPEELRVATSDLQSCPRRELLVIATGSQAEPRAALTRLARGEHPHLALEHGDTVLLSARAIPGNEVSVMRMVGDLWRRGCEVRLASMDPAIHASGHAHRDEQRRMIDLVQPRSFVPVHGTRHHLERHAALARDAGVPEVLVVENGQIVELDEAGARRAETFPTGRVAVAEGYVVPEEVLRDRSVLSEVGVVAAAVRVDERGRPTGPTVVSTRGVMDEAVSVEALAEAALEVNRTLESQPWTTERPTDEEVGEIARLALRRALHRHVGTKPVALPLVLRQPR